MRWWRPLGPVEPMYIPGRLRTGSSPFRTVRSFAVYDPDVAFFGGFWPLFWPWFSGVSAIAMRHGRDLSDVGGANGEFEGKIPGHRGEATPNCNLVSVPEGGDKIAPPRPSSGSAPAAVHPHLDSPDDPRSRDGSDLGD